MNYDFIEGFCGPGGMSLGLREAGFTERLAFDIDPASVKTHKENLGDTCCELDAEWASSQLLRDRAGLGATDELFLFAGGPPCQGFSKQKRGAHNGDDRNRLIFDYVRFVRELKPLFFFFENVAIFGQKRGKLFRDSLQEELEGYEIQSAFLNAANYGLAQTRERFVIVGSRRDLGAEFKFPRPTVRRWRTVKEAIGNLPSPPVDYSVHPKYTNHQRAKVTDLNIKRFSYVPPGGGWQDIPEDLRLPCHQKVDPKSGGWPDVYGRLRWEGQCPTITGGFDSFTRGRYGHPDEDRPLTPREAARIQGFPDSFSFVGTRGEVRSQIGNAVPPPLAKAIGQSIKKAYAEALSECKA